MSAHLLHLPKELLEKILVIICRDNPQSIPTCRQTCRTLQTIIAQSIFVQYLERLTLLGMHDPQLHIDDGGSVTVSPPATLVVPDRMAALEALEEGWNSLGASGNGIFWRKRIPDLCITMPPWRSTKMSSPRVKRMLATILDPDPFPEALQLNAEIIEAVAPDDSYESHFSFGPCFITSTQTGLSIGYSYLDLHGHLGETGTETSALDEIQVGKKEGADVDADYDRLDWTVINFPVWDVVEIALSTELDLAVVISKNFRSAVELEGQGEETCRLAVRLLRFRDGTPHPHALVPKMRFPVIGVSVLRSTQTQVLGDYLLLWIIGANDGDYRLLYVIAWKLGSITLVWKNSNSRTYGLHGGIHMISNDVVALIQLDPPGIELYRLSNMRNEGATSSRDHSNRNDEPRMDRLCTLLFPPVKQGASVIWARYVGEHSRNQRFSREPWLEHHRAPLGRSPIFRQSNRNSVVTVVMGITGCGGRMCTFDVVVRCDTLLSYADGVHVVPTAAVVGDINAKESNEIDVVSWDAWGPRATSVTALVDSTVTSTYVRWRDSFGERRAFIENGGQTVRIRDYNSYRIRRARDSNVGPSPDQNGTRRIVESSTIQGGEWFEEDVTTVLPYLDIMVDVRGCKMCREIYLEQDEVLLRVDNLRVDEIRTGQIRQNGGQVKGLALYSLRPEYEYNGAHL